MENKRASRRFNVITAPLSCTRCDSDDSVDILDISCSGIGMSTDERLQAGAVIELEIIIPGDDIPMFVKAEVTWTEKDKKLDSRYNSGLTLKTINAADRKRLVKYIDDSFVRVHR